MPPKGYKSSARGVKVTKKTKSLLDGLGETQDVVTSTNQSKVELPIPLSQLQQMVGMGCDAVSVEEVKTRYQYDSDGRIMKDLKLLQTQGVAVKEESLKGLINPSSNFQWSSIQMPLRLVVAYSERVIKNIDAEINKLSFPNKKRTQIKVEMIKRDIMPIFKSLAEKFIVKINFLTMDKPGDGEHNIQPIISSPDADGEVVSTADFVVSGLFNFLAGFNNRCDEIVSYLYANVSTMQMLVKGKKQYGSVAVSGVEALNDTPTNILMKIITEGKKRLSGLEHVFSSQAPISTFTLEAIPADLNYSGGKGGPGLFSADNENAQQGSAKPDLKNTSSDLGGPAGVVQTGSGKI